MSTESIEPASGSSSAKPRAFLNMDNSMVSMFNLLKEGKLNGSDMNQAKPSVPSTLELKKPEHREAFEELKRRLASQNISLSEEFVKRFLIAREYSVEEAETNIKEYQKWLQEMKFDGFKWDDPAIFSDFLHPRVIKLLGYDREGRPVVYIRASNYSPSKTSEELFRKHLYSFLETVTGQMKPGVEQYIFIADLTDMGKENVSLGQSKTLAKDLLRYFPGYNYKVYVVNGGFIMNMLFNMIKPLLYERHKKKVVFCSTDKKEAYNLLKEDMDDGVIPVHFGGKNMDA